MTAFHFAPLPFRPRPNQGVKRCVSVRAHISRQSRARTPRTAPQTATPKSSPSPPTRYITQDAASGELYSVADVRCSAFYAHATDQYFFPLRRREMYTALVERVSAGTRCLVVRDMSPPPEWAPFTSKDGALVVASLDLALHRNCGARTSFDDADASCRLYVSSMAVRSEWRRRGLASRLLLHVEQIAKEIGVAEINLHVDECNNAAVQLYRTHSFSYVSEPRTNWLNFLAKSSHTLLRKNVALPDQVIPTKTWASWRIGAGARSAF